ncbi:MAG: hypothetical protein Q4C22_05225, partial [Bacillota bacterium]|nr:hypothetical protein [Bacillota bacterium]
MERENEKVSVERAREQFKNMMDEHLEPDAFPDGTPMSDPDLSFLDRPHPRRKASARPILKVAVILLALFVCSTGIALWMNSGSAEAFKFNIEKRLLEMRS